MQQAIGRIDDRLGILPVRRERGTARRRELTPRARIVHGCRSVVVEIDRRHAHDPAVAHEDEDRAAIGHVTVARDPSGMGVPNFQADGLAQHDGLRPPVGEIVGAVDREVEFLDGVDLLEPVDRRHQQRGADRGVLERERHVRLGVLARARRDAAAEHLVPARGLLVARLDLRNEVALLQARAKRRMAPRRELERLGEAPQDGGEFRGGDRHGTFLLAAAPRAIFVPQLAEVCRSLTVRSWLELYPIVTTLSARAGGAIAAPRSALRLGVAQAGSNTQRNQ